MFPGRSWSLLMVLLLLPPPAVRCTTTQRGAGSAAGGGAGRDQDRDSLRSALKNTVSPAFGATVIMVVMVLVSGSAYLCFLRYVCGGCCQPLQVVPTAEAEPDKVEEQV